MQVAAVDKPKVHLWETGITRITRHPQNTGQLIWCLGHLLWIGNSFMVATSAALVAHHVFACYHGDFRLRRKHGEVRLLSLALFLLYSVVAVTGVALSHSSHAIVSAKRPRPFYTPGSTSQLALVHRATTCQWCLLVAGL